MINKFMQWFKLGILYSNSLCSGLSQKYFKLFLYSNCLCSGLIQEYFKLCFYSNFN